MIATGADDRTVRLWQPEIGRLMRFKRLASKVTALAWTPDGSCVLAGCQDGSVNVIDAETLVHTEQQSASAARITALVVHPSEPFALSGDSNGRLIKRSLVSPEQSRQRRQSP